jgi:hypothetical protein
MSAPPPRRYWKIHACGLAGILAVYLLAVYHSGTAYQSSRLVNPVRIGPNMFMAGPGGIYRGQRVEFGWPFLCVAWREEAKGLMGTPEGNRMHIVAIRVSGIACALNILCVLAVYGLIALVCTLINRPRWSWQLLLLAVSCLVSLTVVGCLWDRRFLEHILVCPDEPGWEPATVTDCARRAKLS